MGGGLSVEAECSVFVGHVVDVGQALTLTDYCIRGRVSYSVWVLSLFSEQC